MTTKNQLLMSAAMILLSCPPLFAQLGGTPGVFSRMGFGARGIGMGNALTSVTSGDIVGYYNPALPSWSDNRSISASFGILSLDRHLNFLGYSQPVAPNAGISAGIINSGTSNIDGRDADGEQTGSLRTSENEVFLSFSNKFKAGFSLGIAFKLLYYHLYTDVSSTNVGLDVGLLVPVGNTVTIGATIRDINSKYRWDTSQIYGQEGTSSTAEYPELYTVGVAWKLPDSLGLVSGEVELSNKSTALARLGAEVPLIPEVSVRAGIDRIDLKEKGNGIQPAFGFTFRESFGTWTPAVNYAFVLEPFSPTAMHVVSLSTNF